MLKTILLICLMLIEINGFSQNSKIQKIEGAVKATLELDNDFSNGFEFNKIPLEYYGLILAYKSEKNAINGMKDFVIKKYDLDLKEEYTEKIAIPSNCDYLEYKLEEEFLYFLFTKDRKFSVLKFNFINKKSTLFVSDKSLKLKTEKMSVKKGIVSLFGSEIINESSHKLAFWLSTPLLYTPMIFYRLKYSPLIVNLDMNSEPIVTKLPMKNLLKSNFEIDQMVTNYDFDETNLILDFRKGWQNATKTLRTLKDNKISKDIFIKAPASIYLESANLNVNERNNKIVYGAYSNKKGKPKVNTSGFYLSSIDSNLQNNFKTIPWSSFSFLKNEKYSKQPFDLNFLFHNVLVKNETKIFFAEVYSPVYIYYSSKSEGPSKVFIGNNFHTAILFAIDKNGKLLWDKSFEFGFELRNILDEKFTFTESKFTITNNAGYAMHVITFDEAKKQTINKEIDIYPEFRPIERFEGDRSLLFGVKQRDNHEYDVYRNTSVLWYDNVYLINGMFTKKAKNKLGAQVKKEVLFFKKIELPN